jgi:hypothetical protein
MENNQYGPTFPDAQPVGLAYKTKKGAMNFLFRNFTGPTIKDRAQFDAEVIRQADGTWQAFILDLERGK